MATLATVANYITADRGLLQDETTPYRYSDANIVLGLNIGLLEARRLRPDLFLGIAAGPEHSSGSPSATVALDEQYRSALMYYIVGHIQLRDEEDTSDARATALLTQFRSQLLGL